MHRKPSRNFLIFLVLVALAALAYWYFVLRPAQENRDSLTASGTIVITQIQIGAEIGGKVVAVSVDDGDTVHAGETLVQLDATLLEAQRAQAEASLDMAKAHAEAAGATVEAAQSSVEAATHNLDLLIAGASEAQLAAAKAQLAQAEANLQAARVTLNALTAGARPEDVNAARQLLQQSRDGYDNLIMGLTSEQVEALQSASNTAMTNLQDAEMRLNDLNQAPDIPEAALEIASQAMSDAVVSVFVTQLAQRDAEDANLPFYRQVELAQLSKELAIMGLSRARARQEALAKMGEMPETALEAAQSEVEAAQALVEDAESAYNALTSGVQEDLLNSAWQDVQTALAGLNNLARSTTTPIETLLNQLDASQATLDLAQANLSLVESGTREEQLKAAEAQVSASQAQLKAAQANQRAALAQVDSAQAALNLLDVQIGKLTVVSPKDGVVLTRVIQPGEIALPSATLLVLGLEEDKSITVYVSEDRYGEITVGQEANVRVDSFPSISFKARVIHISDKAEFTPRNVQTVEGRKNTVFAIRLKIIDADNRLKAGMPADVTFE